MKSKDLKQLSVKELETRAAELRGMIRNLRFNITTRQNSKVRNLRTSRKELAQILTILTINKIKV